MTSILSIKETIAAAKATAIDLLLKSISDELLFMKNNRVTTFDIDSKRLISILELLEKVDLIIDPSSKNSTDEKGTQNKGRSKIDRKKFPNAGKSWTESNDENLRKMFDSKTSMEKLTTEFGRTEVAINDRLVKLGLVEDSYRGGNNIAAPQNKGNIMLKLSGDAAAK